MFTHKKSSLNLDIETLTPLLQGISKKAGQGHRWKKSHPQELESQSVLYI